MCIYTVGHNILEDACNLSVHSVHGRYGCSILCYPAALSSTSESKTVRFKEYPGSSSWSSLMISAASSAPGVDAASAAKQRRKRYYT